MKIKRIFAAFLALAILITSYGTSGVYAAIADIPTQPAPSNLAIRALNANTEAPIGYSSTDGGASGFYADIAWGSVSDPEGITPSGKYVNIYLEESAKGYRTVKGAVLKEKDMPADTTPIRMRNLNSGTVYKANAKAYYEYIDSTTNTRHKSDESASSNTVKFLTDIKLQCVTMSSDKVKIIWDDVWNEGKRIGYKLYVSQNKDFTNTLPIYISDDQINDDGPVVVNKTDGTLEYVHSVDDAGRVYYVKVVPDISDPEIIKSESSNVVITCTYILVKTSKMATTDAGTIWRLDWSPVVTGLSNANIKVQYQIDKYIGNVPVPVMIEDSNTTFITVPEGEQVSYYIIRAEVTKDGISVYPDSVKIVSDKITLKESEVAATPPMPELVSQFVDSAGEVIISYTDILNVDGSVITKGQLGKDTATVLWRTPKKADGTIDENVLYDIWLIEDPDDIDDPPTATNIKSDFQPGESNFVKDVADSGKTIGYKYKLEDLQPNHTYYFKIIAKKVFAEEVDGVIQSVEHASSPALKVVITLPGGAIDRPLLPSNPPLEIRKQASGKDMITYDSVTIQLKNRWYEEFYALTGKWKYVKADKTSSTDNTVTYDPVNTPPDNLNYRKVSYDEGVTLYVGCEEYYEGIDISTIDDYKLEKVPTTPNDPTENIEFNVPENIPNASTPPVYAKHNVVVPVNELKPNTTYILWVRAARDGTPEQFSETSNPIIFTTLPSPAQIVEKPVVPTFTYNYVADTFVDLGWEYQDGNTYYIKYATVDDPAKAGESIEVTTSQIKQSGVNYVRIPGLKPNTQYYFWIQAEAFSSDLTVSKKSEWSDSLPLRTLKDIPPNTPRGFGVKNTSDAVTKNSITFEWVKEDGLEYILEVASGVDYTDVKQYKAGSVSEFKVDGLTSNFRYFARLYAYDPKKELTSLPTQSVSVRTLRSSDDYDSDQDVDNVITGEFIDKATTVVSGTWTIKIIGVNADRLIEFMSTDSTLDYTIDVSKPPSVAKNISLVISKKVFDKLAQLKENLTFKTSTVSYNLKSGILSNVTSDNTGKEQLYVFNITLLPSVPSSNANELLLRQPLAEIGLTLDTGASNIIVSEFATQIVVNYPYTNSKDYDDEKTFGYIYNTRTSNWEKLSTSGKFDVDNNIGVISFQSQTPGLFALADRTNSLFDDIYGYEYEDSIINVAFIHKLKSISGRMFEPYEYASIGDTIKLVYDVLEYTYGSEYMKSAVKAGLIKPDKSSSTTCTRQEAAYMVAVLYEIKSGTRVQGNTSMISNYSDYTSFDKELLSKVAFAVENGFVPNASSTQLKPNDPITRGELMFMIERALALAGEIE